MSEWYRNASEFRSRLLGAGNLNRLAYQTGVPRRTLRRWAERHGIGPTIDADENTIESVLPPHPKRGEESRTPEQILVDHGLDPDVWDVASYKDNYWRGNDGEGPAYLTQSKVTARRKIPADVQMPPRTDAPLRKVQRARKATRTKPLLIALASDQHCPHQDPGLEACWHAWLEDVQPDKLYLLGDIVNLSKPSRHRQNLSDVHNDDPEECFTEAVAWLRRTLEAAPGVEAHYIAGNHDLRCQIATMERLPELYTAKRPGEDYPWWDLEYWLALDKLGITYHRPKGEYHSVEVQIAPGFGVAHGAKAGPYGGAAKDQARHEGSRAVGHDHRQALTYVVRYRDGEPHQHVAVSVGTQSRRDLGYTPDPDIVQGFATLVVHADGYWNVELARYDDRRKTLVWRDQRYTAR